MLEQNTIDSLFSNLDAQTLQNLKSYVIGYITGSVATVVFYGTLESWKKHRAKRTTSAILKDDEAGSIFLTLFAAIAILGVLASGISMVMRGPVTTMADVTRRTIAENNIIAASKLAVVSASTQANSGDCDGDGFVEPIAYRDAGAGPKPAGGGYLPSTIGATQLDPWQTQYGYCVWDAGPQTVSNNVAACGGNTAKRLNGAPNGTQYVVAVISAGKDKTFQTACNAYADANNDGQPDTPLVNKPSGSDDITIGYTYAEATSIGGSLWTLKSGAPSVATISKDLEVAGGASFSGSLRLGKGLILPSDPGDDSLTGACNAANDQQIRINKASTPPKLEICDFSRGATTWQPISGASSLSSGMIVAFSSATCPTNWSEYTLARGRFLRGIDNGAGNDPDGTRTAGSIQADAFQNHRHDMHGNYSNNLNGGNQAAQGGGWWYNNIDPHSAMGGPTEIGAGTPRVAIETRPKNVAVTYCQYTGPVVSGGGTGGPGTGVVAGINGSVQYNTNGTITGDTKFIYNGTDVSAVGQFISSGASAAFVPTDRNDNTKTSALYRASNQTRIWDNTGGDRITIDNNSGSVGIGKAPSGYKMEVAGDVAIDAWFRTRGNTGWYNDTYGGGWYMADTTWLRAYADKNVYTGGTMLAGAMQANSIYSPGNIQGLMLVAVAPGDGWRLGIDAQNYSGAYGGAIRALSNPTGYYCYIGSAGAAISCNGPAYGTSDVRLKKNIRPLQESEGLDAVMAVKPVRYLWKDDRRNKMHPNGEIGFIAQNVEKVLPDMVSEFIEERPEAVAPDKTDAAKDGNTAARAQPIDPKLDKNGDPIDPRLFKHKSLSYDRMVVPAILAIQQLKHQFDALRAEIMALFDRHTDQLAKLTARMDAAEAENRVLRERLDDMEAMQDECAACSL